MTAQQPPQSAAAVRPAALAAVFSLPAGRPSEAAADFCILAAHTLPPRTRNGADVGRTPLAGLFPRPHRRGEGEALCIHGVPRGALCAPCSAAYSAHRDADDSDSDDGSDDDERGYKAGATTDTSASVVSGSSVTLGPGRGPLLPGGASDGSVGTPRGPAVIMARVSAPPRPDMA
ncbi:hypothetical protein DFJ74DRAFT_708488 [Hyaloraphidium curvatum]|nr:hypothetical protein DFJ74DRAFT_708488 [Hyaloraphidium curvatum]